MRGERHQRPIVLLALCLLPAHALGDEIGRGIERSTSWGVTTLSAVAYTGGFDFPLGGGLGMAYFPTDAEKPEVMVGVEGGLFVASSHGFVRPYFGLGASYLTFGGGFMFGTHNELAVAISPEVAAHLRRRSGVWRPSAELYLQGNLFFHRRDAFPDSISLGLRLLVDL